MAMLNKWKQKFGKKATVEVLRKALEEIERVDLSERVEGHTDSSVRSPTQTPPPSESSLTSNTIRHR